MALIEMSDLSGLSDRDAANRFLAGLNESPGRKGKSFDPQEAVGLVLSPGLAAPGLAVQGVTAISNVVSKAFSRIFGKRKKRRARQGGGQ